MRVRLFAGLFASLGAVAFVACVGDEPAATDGSDGGGGSDSSIGDGNGGGDTACTPNCGSSCVDLTSDGKNCGACGHDCLDSTCTASQCDAKPLFSGTSPDAATAGVAGIGVDGTNLFWITPLPIHPGGQSSAGTSTIYQCPAAGPCSVPSVYFQQTVEVDSILLGAPGTFYLGDNGEGSVDRVRTDGVDAAAPIANTCNSGGNPCILYQALGASAIATDGVRVFTGTNGDGVHGSGTYAGTIDGGTPHVMGSAISGSPGAFAITADGTNGFVYVAMANGTIYFYKTTDQNAAATNTVPGQTVVGQMMVAHALVFWTRPDTGDVLTVPVCVGTSCGNGAPSPTPTTFANVAESFAITSDATNAYWSAGSNVYTCPLTGCTGAPKKIGSGTARIHAITNDATAVYWGDDQGSIWRLAK